MKKKKSPGSGIRYFIALLICCSALLLPTIGKAQFTCSTALNLGTNFQTEIRTLSNDDVWVSFNGSTSLYAVTLRPEFPSGASPNPTGDHVDTIEVWKGSACGSLSLMYTYVRPAGAVISFNFPFANSTHYFLRISAGCKCNDLYILSLLQYGPSVCEANCNLSCNGNFDLTSTPLPVNPYAGNIGYAGCWNTFYDTSIPGYEDMTNYSGYSPGAYQGTPDYYNVSSNTPPNTWNYSMGIPSNDFGNQAALTGGGYAGIYAHITWPGYFNSPLSTGNYGRYYREYVQQEMCDSMIAGHKYIVTFSASLADQSALSTYLGFLLTTDTIWQPDVPPTFPAFFGCPYTAQTPQYETPTQVTNMTGWSTFTDTITATANFKHISIGNFRLPGAGNQTQLNSNVWHHDMGNGYADSSQIAYYYIDGVSVIPYDSIIQNKDTSFLCLNMKDTLFSYLSSHNPYVSYSWISSPTDTSLTNWLADPANPDSMVVVHPVTNTTYYVTISDTLYHCSYQDTFYIQVTGITLDSLTGNTFKCDTLAQYILYSNPNDPNVVYNWFTNTGDAVTGNGNDTVTVNWSASQGNNSWLYVYATDTLLGCTYVDSIFVKSCCISDTGRVFYNDTASVVFGSNPGTIFFQHFNINGTFVIDQDMTFIGCNFNMGPNASIIVSGGSTVDFQVDSLKAGCCEMWDGLIGMTVSDTIIVEKNSYLGDAVRGIVSMNGSVYMVKGHVTFNRNYVSITVNPYAGTHAGSVREATFTSVTANYCPSFSGTLLAPYTNQWPLYGISATSVDSITFGNPASAGYVNVFTNLRHGIRTKNTNSTIYNNQFNTVNKAGVTSKAIWCVGRFPTISPFNLTQYTVTVGGIGLYRKNKFLNCPFGVYSDTAMSTIVINNKFLQTYPPNALTLHATAIRVNNCKGYSRVVNIFSDTISNHSYGVYLNQNNSCFTQVNRNYIYRTQGGTTICTAVYQICNGANIGTTVIDTNTVNNVQYGIRIFNAKNVTAEENRIYVRVTTSSVQPVRGIWAANCTGIKIRSNYLYKENPTVTNTSNWIGGIYVSNCAASKVTCNLISKIGYGILFDGNGSANSTVFDNQLLDTYTGIWLRSGGLISQQGDSLTANDNVWQGAVTNRLYSTGTSSLITYGFLSPFYYRPAGGIYLPTPSNNILPSWQVTSTTTSISNPTEVTCKYTSPPSHSDGQNGDIAQGLIDFDGNEVAGTWMSRESLYRLFGEDTTFAVGDTILLNFKDSADAANIGKLAAAMDVHSKGGLNSSAELTAAYNSVTGISPDNDLETNYQIVESILLYHEINGGEYIDAELDELRTIAQLCPFTDGNAVYMARGLLAPIDTIEYGNSCVGDSAGYRIAAPVGQTENVFAFSLFPNPSSGSITINYQLNENETGVVEIYSIAGSFITSIQLLPGQQVRTVLLPQLGAGTYLYKVTVDGEMKVADRLVIIK